MIRVLYLSTDELFKQVIELAFYNYHVEVELVTDENGFKTKLRESDIVIIDTEFFPSFEQFVNICKSADKPVILLQNVFESGEKSDKTDGVILLQKPFDDLSFIKEVKKCCDLKLKTGENNMADTTKEKDKLTMNEEEEILELTDIIEEAADDVSDILANKEQLESDDDLTSSSFEQALKEESEAKTAEQEIGEEEQATDIFSKEEKSDEDIFSFESKEEVDDDEPLLELKDGKLTSSKETVNDAESFDTSVDTAESDDILELHDESEEIVGKDVSDNFDSEDIFSEKEEDADVKDSVPNVEAFKDELQSSEVAEDMSEQQEDVLSQKEILLSEDTESLETSVPDDEASTVAEEVQAMENTGETGEADDLFESEKEQLEDGEEIMQTEELSSEEKVEELVSNDDVETPELSDSVSDEENELSEPELELESEPETLEETDNNIDQKQDDEKLIEDESDTVSELTEDIQIPIDEETKQLAHEIDNGKEDDDFMDMEVLDDLKADFRQEHVKRDSKFTGQEKSSIDLSMVEIKLIEASGKILEAIEEATVEIAKGIAKVTPKIIEEVSKEIIPKIAQKIISDELNNITKKDKES